MYSTAFLAAAFATATAVAAPVGNDAQADSIDKRSGHYAGYSGHRSPSKYGGVANTGKGTYYHGKYYNSIHRRSDDSDSSDSDDDDDKKKKKKKKSKSKSKSDKDKKKKKKKHSSSYVNKTGASADVNGVAAAAANTPNSAMSASTGPDSDADDDDDSDVDDETQQALNCLSKSDAQALIKNLASQGATNVQLAQAGQKIPSLNQKNWKAPSYCAQMTSKRSLADLD